MTLKFEKGAARVLAVVLLGGAMLLAVLIAVKLASFVGASDRVENLLAKAVREGKHDPNNVQAHLVKTKAAADGLKQKNLFAPPEPKTNPVKEVVGIFGSEAFINGKWYKVGDKIGDAKIAAIEPTYVKVLWDGKEHVFFPIAAAGSAEPTGEPGQPVAKEPPKPPITKAQAPAPKAEPTAVTPSPTAEDPLAFMGIKMSDRLRAMLLEKWNSASDQEKEQAKSEWGRMSEEQKRLMVEQIEKSL